jgi:hypothetical protein
MSQDLAKEIAVLFLGGLAFTFLTVAIVNFYRDLKGRLVLQENKGRGALIGPALLRFSDLGLKKMKNRRERVLHVTASVRSVDLQRAFRR